MRTSPPRTCRVDEFRPERPKQLSVKETPDSTPADNAFFRDPDFTGVSAIIYSPFCHDAYAAGDGRELSVIHNVFATNPLPPGAFPFGIGWGRSGDNIARQGLAEAGRDAWEPPWRRDRVSELAPWDCWGWCRLRTGNRPTPNSTPELAMDLLLEQAMLIFRVQNWSEWEWSARDYGTPEPRGHPVLLARGGVDRPPP
jgi:hypothetical protein